MAEKPKTGTEGSGSKVPAVGTKAPPFRLPSSNGDTLDLKTATVRGPVVLFFYPKADTPGCTKEACGFRDAADRFRAAGVTVWGISPDPPERVRKFAEKYGLGYPLLADADHAVAERYGVWRLKSMYGRQFWGVARTTFVIGADGKVLRVFESVKPQGHEQEVLDWVEKMRG